MKKIVLLAVAVLTLNQSYAQEAKLSGKISNPTGKTVFLYTSVIENEKPTKILLDSATIATDGTYSMQVKIKKTTTCLFSDGGERTMMLLSPNDDIHLNLNTFLFDETLVYSGKGAAKNNAIKNVSLYEEYINNTFMEFPEEMDSTETYAFLEEGYKNYSNVINDYKKELPGFVAYGDELLGKVEHSKAVAKDYVAKKRSYKKIINALTGAQGIDFEGITLKGEPTKLSDFKGKITVIDFWATWCSPCKKEMPAFKALEEKYGTEVNFVSVALWCSQKGWEKMATELGFENNMYLKKGTEEQISVYAVNFIPRYIVLDENFKIIDADAPRPSSGDLEKMISEK